MISEQSLSYWYVNPLHKCAGRWVPAVWGVARGCWQRRQQQTGRERQSITRWNKGLVSWILPCIWTWEIVLFWSCKLTDQLFPWKKCRWTKSKYAYLNQPAIGSMDTPKRRRSSYIPNVCSYKLTPPQPTYLGVF